jgi:hypothetical protein
MQHFSSTMLHTQASHARHNNKEHKPPTRDEPNLTLTRHHFSPNGHNLEQSRLSLAWLQTLKDEQLAHQTNHGPCLLCDSASLVPLCHGQNCTACSYQHRSNANTQMTTNRPQPTTSVPSHFGTSSLGLITHSCTKNTHPTNQLQLCYQHTSPNQAKDEFPSSTMKLLP